MRRTGRRLQAQRHQERGSGRTRAGRPYHVLHFFERGEFAGWYVNFESPIRWTGGLADTRDWHLDLKISPDGGAEWKDEDEFHLGIEHGWYTPEQFAELKAVGLVIADHAKTGGSPFNERWEHWRPDGHWEPAGLPEGFDS